MTEKLTHVVVAVIHHQAKIVLAKRPEHVHQGGLWEFPGGKIEANESPEQALVRELQEELGITPTAYRPLIKIPHHYPQKSVLLDVWIVEQWQGQLQGAEGQQIKLAAASELHRYDFPEANAAIITACQLPDRYLITPALQGSEDDFLAQLENTLQTGIRLLQLRQPELQAGAFKSLANRVIDCCHHYGARVLLNSDVETARHLQADGVHLNSHRLMQAGHIHKTTGFLLAASCHTVGELQHAAKLGCDFALLSTVQQTASHPGKIPLGWERFADMTATAIIPVYALGGMNTDLIPRAQQAGAQGIAAISALWKYTP